MKLVQFKTPGPPSVLEIVEVPKPAPKESEVLVRAEAIGVGMPDIMIRRGSYNWMPPLPGTPGKGAAALLGSSWSARSAR